MIRHHATRGSRFGSGKLHGPARMYRRRPVTQRAMDGNDHNNQMKGMPMRLSRLILCFLIAATGLAGVVGAQPCYRKTDEHAWGNALVKPMTDSTCFGQWYGTLYYHNYKTGNPVFSFRSEEYFPFPHISTAIISDVLMLDSLLVLSWMEGAVYRILKVDFLGAVSELPTGLDSIPMLKYGGDFGGRLERKLNLVNDSVFLISGNLKVYSFLRVADSVMRVDSLSIQGSWSALDLYGDTIVILSGRLHEARFYHVDAGGRIAHSATVGVDSAVRFFRDVCFRYGNLYAKVDNEWRAMLRTPEGFRLTQGRADDVRPGVHRPLFGRERIVLLENIHDEFRVYDKELNLLCYQSPVSSPGALASGIYGHKVFTANSSGISTWLPDTVTMSIAAPPLARRPTGIEVWPNPSASGMIAVRVEAYGTAVDLTDATGRVVYRASLTGGGATFIPTAFLPSGVYFVNVHTEQGLLSERVVIFRAAK
jgi:hypothetical protein